MIDNKNNIFMPQIIYRTNNKIEHDCINSTLIDVLCSMNVPHDAIHHIYVCDVDHFKKTAIELNYNNNLDSENYIVYGLTLNKNILFKDFLFNQDIYLRRQINIHVIRHEIGHILDNFYRGCIISCTLQEKIYEFISGEYNAERYCRNFITTELEKFFKSEIEEETNKLINKINKTVKNNCHNLLAEFCNTVAKVYSYKSFLKICDMDQLFNDIKPNEKFEKFISTEWNFYFN